MIGISASTAALIAASRSRRATAPSRSSLSRRFRYRRAADSPPVEPLDCVVLNDTTNVMGFDTYLQVDDRVLLMWRKHASILPRVLFRFEDLHIAPGVDPDGDSIVEVGFKTSVQDALTTLDEGGLGWRAAVAAYAEIRFSGYSAGMVMGRALAANDAERAQELEEQLAAFEALPGDEDLRNLGALMVTEWQDDGYDRVSLLSELTYDGDLPPAGDAAFQVREAADKRRIANPFAAARASESLALLDRTAPMLAWPLAICVFLHQLPSDSSVHLVLTEDAAVSAGVHDALSAREYATKYWSAASDALAREARTLERLFAVLAGSSVGAGPEFWFARAVDLLGRVRSLSSTPDVTTRARGDALESLVDALVHTEEPELQVVEKNLRTREEEIDLVLSNGLREPFWSALSSPLILVECKNWSQRVGVPELRIFESKMQDRAALCRVGIFVSLSGFTRTFLTRLTSIQADVGVIFAIDGDDLSELVNSKRRITD